MGIVESALGIVGTLDRYADSPAFLGYFESLRKDGTAAAVALFLASFTATWPTGHLLVALVERASRAPAQTPAVCAAIGRLRAAGWLSAVEGDASPGALKSVPLVDVDPALLADLCSLALDGFLFGHAFFFWSEEQLLVYPHDDRGFAVLVPRGAPGEARGRAFLAAAGSTAGLTADVRR